MGAAVGAAVRAPWPLHHRLEFLEAAMQDPLKVGKVLCFPQAPSPAALTAAAASLPSRQRGGAAAGDRRVRPGGFSSGD